MKEKILPVAFPSFQSRVHSVHTTLQTARKPMAAAIRLLLPTLAQDNAREFVRKSKTQFLPKSKPHAQKLLTQFLRHLPTHHPEIETISKILTITKSENSVISVERYYWGMAWHCLQRAVWRNGGCGSLESTTKQRVKWLVASVGSPPLRQAAATLVASEVSNFTYLIDNTLSYVSRCVYGVLFRYLPVDLGDCAF